MEEFLISVTLLILLFLVPLSPMQLFAGARISIINNTKDYESLFAFKHQLQKQSSASSAILSSWNDSKHFCSWEGVSCSRRHRERVTVLDLSSRGLVGPLPPFIANLTFLRRFDLSLNKLYGEIPPDLVHLQRLQYLNLSFNLFYGEIPSNLTHNSMLQVLDLCCNEIIGNIPPIINSMSQLHYLHLGNNSITGPIPPSLGNLSFLETLFVYYNHLEGDIPLEIGGLHRLINLNVADNNLTGIIPFSFYNLSSLRRNSMTNNHLSGEISVDIAKAFPDLEIFLIAINHFIGSLEALQNVTSLMRLDISKNNFTGVVPPHIGKMQNLRFLNFEYNELIANDAGDWRFLDSLNNCTYLEIIGLRSNNLGGMLPKSINNLSAQLQELTLGINHISGSIPFGLDKYAKLIGLGMELNLLEGPIPESIAKLGMLQVLTFSSNRLAETIPYSLGNLTRLLELDLSFNQLAGSIPSTFSNLTMLNYLTLSHNNLNGLIPKEIFLISSLPEFLDLSVNSFIGALPLEVGHLINLQILDVSNNKLMGIIPEALGSCQMLSNLNMNNNNFFGSIPTSLGKLKGLEILDLSHNNLSGAIPPSLQDLSLLKLLNLSFNNLKGEVPSKGVFQNSTVISLFGNEELCGGIPELNLPKCATKTSTQRSKHKHYLLKVLMLIVSVLFALLLLLCFTFICIKQKQKRRRNSSDSSFKDPFPRISYVELAKATNNFSLANLIGRGSCGSVYKGTLQKDQTVVAVKVFNLDVHGGFKSFIVECDVLRSIRHRNLVSVITSCSSIDFQGRDFKALVFEFMPKGNLGMWLHQDYESDNDLVLNLEQRLNIAIDVANALEYLHHSCQPSIIHFDIKPSNILLDNDMTAHVGDFGLAGIFPKNVSMSLQDSDNKGGIKGTIGYIAPEYAEGVHPSSVADVYSFGILLLEMLTGRRPIDDMFKDDLNLYKHVEMAFPHRIMEIVDFKMFVEEQKDANMKECFLFLAKIGLSCSNPSPEERPNMREVAIELDTVRVGYYHSN